MNTKGTSLVFKLRELEEPIGSSMWMLLELRTRWSTMTVVSGGAIDVYTKRACVFVTANVVHVVRLHETVSTRRAVLLGIHASPMAVLKSRNGTTPAFGRMRNVAAVGRSTRLTRTFSVLANGGFGSWSFPARSHAGLTAIEHGDLIGRAHGETSADVSILGLGRFRPSLLHDSSPGVPRVPPRAHASPRAAHDIHVSS